MANKIQISGEEGSEESSSFSFLVAQEALALVWVKDSFSGFQVSLSKISEVFFLIYLFLYLIILVWAVL